MPEIDYSITAEIAERHCKLLSAYSEFSDEQVFALRSQLVEELTSNIRNHNIQLREYVGLKKKESEAYKKCLKCGVDVLFIDQLLCAFAIGYQNGLNNSKKEAQDAYKEYRSLKSRCEYLYYYFYKYQDTVAELKKGILKEIERLIKPMNEIFSDLCKADADKEIQSIREKTKAAYTYEDYKTLRNDEKLLIEKPYRFPLYGHHMFSNVIHYTRFENLSGNKSHERILNALIIILVEHFMSHAGDPKYSLVYDLMDLHDLFNENRKIRKDKKRHKNDTSYASRGKIIQDRYYKESKNDNSYSTRIIYRACWLTYKSEFSPESLYNINDK